VGFGRACAPVRCARPSFWVHCHAKRGAARPPPSQLRCFLFDPQKYLHSIELGPPTSRAFFYPVDHRGYEIGSPLPPRPTHRSFAVSSGNVFGVNLCTNATRRPNVLGFFFFYSFRIFSFCYSLLFRLSFSFSFSSYSSLLILLFLWIICYTYVR
jgi:hypothetical protein